MNKLYSYKESEEEELNEALDSTIERWADMVKWEETPFSSRDDVILLGFGFKYSSTGQGMQKVTEGGDTWYVSLGSANPVWYKNGKRLGTMTYDEVVNLFRKRDERLGETRRTGA